MPVTKGIDNNFDRYLMMQADECLFGASQTAPQSESAY
jgi:hypothetical protein